MFETTSLYGSSKSSSQYDGMKPFLRYKGNTDSDFAPLINDDNFLKLNDWFKKNQPNVVIIAAAKVGGIFANDSFPADFLLENLKEIYMKTIIKLFILQLTATWTS